LVRQFFQVLAGPPACSASFPGAAISVVFQGRLSLKANSLPFVLPTADSDHDPGFQVPATPQICQTLRVVTVLLKIPVANVRTDKRCIESEFEILLAKSGNGVVMTYVTGFFLVFAGMLIGYFLWYRDRSEEEQLRLTLTRDNEDLRTSLKMAHNSHEILDERFTSQKGQLNVLQQLCDDWSASREQSERDRAQLEIEAEDKRKKLDDTTAELQQVKQAAMELEDQVHDLNQHHLKNLNEVEQSWREKHAIVESKLLQKEKDWKASVGKSERLTGSLHQAEARIAELESEIEANKKLLGTATLNASGLKQEYVSLESSLAESSGLLKRVRSESATALSEKKVAEESLTALQEQHEKLIAETDELRSRLSALESRDQEADSLKQALENSGEKLVSVVRQRDHALQSEKNSVSLAAGLQHRIDNQETTIHGLREKQKDALEGLQRELQLRTKLESTIEAQRQELESRINEQQKQLHARSHELASQFEQKQASFQAQLNSYNQTIEKLASERDSLRDELNQTQDNLAETSTEIDRYEQATHRLNSEVDELKTVCERIGELEKLLAERNAQAAQMAVDSENLRAKSTENETRLQDLQAQLEQYAASQDQFEADKRDYELQLDSIRKKLRASEETIRTLRRERAGVLARLANYRTVAEPDATVISFTQAMQQRKKIDDGEYDREYGGHTRHDEVRGLVYTSAPESRDDLKRISGIAEVLEARLNDYGIYTFKQVMEWKPAAIEEFSRLLAFRDRIERDDWKGQAKFFYEQKQKQSPAAA
jgi:predicted flap endonuclease-1-like 5' DNA nuclease